jgi:hypothetical protein
MVYRQKIWFSFNGEVIPGAFTAYESPKKIAFTRTDTFTAETAELHRIFESQKEAQDAARRELGYEIQALENQLTLRKAALAKLEQETSNA